MLKLLKALRQDEYGVILSTEIVIVGSLLVIGMITGLTCLQKSVNGELRDVANAVGALDQSYSFSSHRKNGGWNGHCCAWTAGSSFVNCEQNQDRCGDISGCEGIVPLHGGACNDCTSTIGVPLHGGSCGVCGGVAGGCNSCASGTFGRTDGSYFRETGVPGMKVTEWPSSATGSTETCPQCVMESLTIPAHSTLQPNVMHEQIEFIHPGDSFPAPPLQPVIEQSTPLAPLPAQEPLPAPMPAQPATTTWLPATGAQFNFPSGAFN